MIQLLLHPVRSVRSYLHDNAEYGDGPASPWDFALWLFYNR